MGHPYNLKSNKGFTELKYEIGYTPANQPAVDLVPHTISGNGFVSNTNYTICSSSSVTNTTDAIYQTPYERATLTLTKSNDGKRLMFRAMSPATYVLTPSSRMFCIPSAPTMNRNVVKPLNRPYMLVNTLMFSLARGKLNVFALECSTGRIADVTGDHAGISGYISMVFTNMYPNLPYTVAQTIMSIIAKELLGMSLKRGMDTSYLMHGSAAYDAYTTIQHITSPYLMSKKEAHLSLNNTVNVNRLVRSDNLKKAVKKTFGRNNSSLMKSLFRFMDKGWVISNVCRSLPSTTSYHYQVTYIGAEIPSFSPAEKVYVDMSILDVINIADSLFDTLDYRDRYIDYFLNYVNEPVSVGHGYFRCDVTLSLLKQFPDNKKFRLLTESIHGITTPWYNTDLLNDTEGQVSEYSDPTKIPEALRDRFPNGLQVPNRWETIQELHDKVSADYNTIKSEVDNKPITYGSNMDKLDGAKVLDTVLVLPRSTKVLVEWGQKLNNCIASYGDRTASGSTMVFALYKDGEPFINCEVTPVNYDIMQIKVNKNGEAPREYREEVSKLLDTIRPKDLNMGISHALTGLRPTLEAGNFANNQVIMNDGNGRVWYASGQGN